MVCTRRAQGEGVWHHAINRGASGAAVFREPEAARSFLHKLGDLERRFGVEVHAYCVMGSHYHLLARAPESKLRPAVAHLEGGPLFRGPFRLLPVRAERHALHVTRYIHLNPVAAGLAARAEDWPWSSYRGYLNPPAGPAWLHTRTLLARFGAIGAHRRYREFVEAGAGDGGRRPGGEPLPAPRVPLAALARVVAGVFGLPHEDLRLGRGRCRTEVVLARGAFVQAAHEIGGWSLRDVATLLRYASPAGPARSAARFREAAASDPELLGRYLTVVKELAT